MEFNKNPLISICIPTYNRAEILKKVVRKLLSLEEFDNDVELVISDNCSPDNTKEIVKELIESYPQKNILYHRNKENIKDKNFPMVLSIANGEYIKLQNDYLVLSNENLKTYKEYVKYGDHSKNLLFYHKIREKINIGDSIEITTLDSFVHIINNKMTWLSNFGCWRDDCKKLLLLNTNSSLQLIQTEWVLELVKSKPTILVNIMYSSNDLGIIKREPYNFFTPHVENYYSILYKYVNQGLISLNTIKYDKYRLLSDFVGEKIIDYLILKKNTEMDIKNSWCIILKYFRKTPYLYCLYPIAFYKVVRKNLAIFVKSILHNNIVEFIKNNIRINKK